MPFTEQSLDTMDSPTLLGHSKERNAANHPCIATFGANTGGLTRPAGNANELDFCIPICDARRGAHADPDRPSFGDPGDPMFGLLADKSHGVCIPFAQNSRDEVRALGQATGALSAEPGMKQQTYIVSPTHSLTANGHDASEDGTGRGTPIVAFTSKDSGQDASHLSPTLRGMAFDASHANGGGQVAIALASTSDPLFSSECAQPITTRNGDCGSVLHDWRVRRLTPKECERLMGLPDDYTRWGADGKELADEPRYKMIGNGWSVPQAEWLASRIADQIRGNS